MRSKLFKDHDDGEKLRASGGPGAWEHNKTWVVLVKACRECGAEVEAYSVQGEAFTASLVPEPIGSGSREVQ